MYCKRCGSMYVLAGIASTCPVCGAMVTENIAPETFTKLPSVDLIPMEDASYAEKPLIALIDTIYECAFTPVHFFEKIKNSTNKLSPITFSLVLGSIGTLASLAWHKLLPNPFFNLSETAFSYTSIQGTNAGSLILSPFFLIMGMFLISAYMQIILGIFHKSRAPFLMTFRTICYTECSAILLVIPWIGGTLSIIFWIYLTLTGIKTVHSMSRSRALLLFSIVPLMLLTVCVIIAIVLVVFIGAFAGNSLKDLFTLL